MIQEFDAFNGLPSPMPIVDDQEANMVLFN
jgi:hypothetical protein